MGMRSVTILTATILTMGILTELDTGLAAAQSVSRHGAAPTTSSTANGDSTSPWPKAKPPLLSRSGAARPDSTSRGAIESGVTRSNTAQSGAPPDLGITVDDGGGAVAPGGSVFYILSTTNNGGQAANGVTLIETVPDGTTFDPVSSTNGWTCSPDPGAGNPCTLSLGGLGAGSSQLVLFSVNVITPAPAGFESISNTVSVADDGSQGADPTPANNTTTVATPVDAAPDLALTNQDNGSVTMAGGAVAFTLGIANVGNQDASGVTVSQLVPDSTTFLAASSTAGWDCVPDPGAGSFCTLGLGSLTFSSSTQASFTVEVSDPVANGVTAVISSASVEDDGASGADPNPGDNDAVASTEIILDAVFVDGFESGDLSTWSDTVPE